MKLMKIIPVQTKIGEINEPVWSVYDFPWNDLVPEWSKYKKRRFICTSFFATFDIETTTTWDIDVDNKPINGNAWLYQWQFCISNKVIFGRTWEEFTELIASIQELGFDNEHTLVCYVHNLSYEFQFMQNFLHWTEIFARQKQKPIRALCAEGIEFRCSYIMSNMSLEKFCDNERGVIHSKNAGVYDYQKIRTPETPLNEIEESYCYNDVRGLYECIQSRLKEDTLLSIPLTSTGYVRREIADAMKADRKSLNKAQEIKLTPVLYELLKDAFRGGDTHANAYWVNETLKELDSFDMTSSYPYVMMVCKFPMTTFIEVSPNSFKKWVYDSEYAVLMHIRLKNVRYTGKAGAPYISISKTQNAIKPVIDNGRVLHADSLELTLTDIDFKIVQEVYSYETLECSRLYASHYDYLPTPIRKTIMYFFTQKCELKGVENKEYEYMRSKNKLNGIYGMMVTDIMQDEVLYNDMEWTKEEPNIEEVIEHYNNSKTRCLAYQWGVWVTAWARRNLHRGCEPLGRDCVYRDTDSNKSFNSHVDFYEKLNNYIIKEEIEKAPIPPQVNVNGKKYYMGVWEHDAHYTDFKTLGAKKYCYKTEKGIGVTVAGLSRKIGREKMELLGSVDKFELGMIFNPSGNMTPFYNYIEPHKITIDNCTFTTASNLALVPTTYTLSITGEYADIIKNMKEIY